MSKLSSIFLTEKKISKILKRTFTTSSVNPKFAKQCQHCSAKSSNLELEPDGGHLIYKRLFLFIALPIVMIVGTNSYLQKKNCQIERPPFVKYEYMRLITKRYPWGDGVHSLFHNPKVNPLPDGYEDELEKEN